MCRENQPLVSIVTPGYNCGAVVHRLLDSVLAQTWQNIEFIFVNDGSTDNTAEVLESYREKFVARGIAFRVIYQENQGQAVALGNGLQYFTGEYLCWCDSDDYYEINAMEIRVQFLEEHPEYGAVTGQAYVRGAADFKIRSVIGEPKTGYDLERQFENLLTGRDVIICCGCHMFRSSAFLQANPDRYIYPSREGQNIQMLWPMFYMHRRHMLYKPVYNYIVYPQSHSHAKRSEHDILTRFYELDQIKRHTLMHMQLPEQKLKRCYEALEINLNREYLGIAREFRDRDLANKQKSVLKGLNAFDSKCKKQYLEASDPVFRFMLRVIRKLRRILKRY